MKKGQLQTSTTNSYGGVGEEGGRGVARFMYSMIRKSTMRRVDMFLS